MQPKNVEEIKRVIRLYQKTVENTEMPAKLALELVLKKIEELEKGEKREQPLFRGFLGC